MTSMPEMGALGAESSLPPQIMNPITTELIRRSGMEGEKWVDKYAAIVRAMIERDPALRELVKKYPKEAAVVIERRLKE